MKSTTNPQSSVIPFSFFLAFARARADTCGGDIEMGQGLEPPTTDLFLFTRSQPPPLPSRTNFFEATSKERARHSSTASSSSSSFGHDGCARTFAAAAAAATATLAVYGGTVSPCPRTVGPSTTTRHSLAVTDEQQHPEHRWRTVTDDIRRVDSLSLLQGKLALITHCIRLQAVSERLLTDFHSSPTKGNKCTA